MEQPKLNTVPALAVKLTPSGQKQQQSNPNFLTALIGNSLPKAITPIILPVLPAESTHEFSQKVSLATKLDPNYHPTDFSLWYEISFAGNDDRKESVIPKDEVQDEVDETHPWFSKVFVNLENDKKTVETLHLLVIGPPPAVNITGDDKVAQQGYLGPAPVGIGAQFAWTVEGGDGKEASLVDCEQGWNLNHVDLVRTLISLYCLDFWGRRD